MDVIDEIQTVRAAAARVGCVVLALGVGPDGHARGRLRCTDGWHAGKLLLALSVIDAKKPFAQSVAAQMRAQAPAAWAFVAYVQAEVQRRIKFRRERGEIFAGSAFTWCAGVGDCDDHARLVYAILAAGGVPVRLGFLYRPDEWREGPRHVAVQAFFDGAWHWVETTVRADLGEDPYAAARRLGILKNRTDIATEIRTMSESDLPPVPAGFDSRTTPAQLASDVKALAELGYLGDASGIDAPDDPRFRVAVQSAQCALGLEPDGLIGKETRAGIGSLVPWYRATMGEVGETSRAFGIDVASPQGTVDFTKAKAGGADFAIVQLTRGNIRDPGSVSRMRAAHDAGLPVLPYHFAILNGSLSPEDQAALFAQAIDDAGGSDGPVALDLEHVDPKTMLSPIGSAPTVEWALRFVREIRSLTGRAVLLYSYPAYLQQLGDALTSSSLPKETRLWIADYSKGIVPSDDAQPHVPAGTWDTWTVWQTHGNDNTPPGSGQSRIPGVNGAVDTNFVNGSLDVLLAPDGGGGVLPIIGAGIALLAIGGLAWYATRS